MSEHYIDGGGNIPMKRSEVRVAHDAINKVRDAEREHCAQPAERLADQGRDGYQIARVIRAGIRGVVGQPSRSP